MQSPQRPKIELITSGAELRRWYWLKDELIQQARAVGINTKGGKFEILERLANYLENGEKKLPSDKIKPRKISNFDWHKEVLSLETVITDNYKNSQNVRTFFATQVGPDFKFNIEFMAWMKANAGKTLDDAVKEYHAMRERMSAEGYKTKIKSHNQFNQYTRDFLADNPQMGMNDVRRVWKLKRSLPSKDGRHVYEKSDLELKE